MGELFFFLEHAGELRIIILSREKGLNKTKNNGYTKIGVKREEKEKKRRKRGEKGKKGGKGKKRKTTKTPIQGHSLLRALAPTNSQSLASSWICKTQAFLCFHIHQATRITNVLNPSLCKTGTRPSAILHQSWNIDVSSPSATSCSPTLHKICHHKFMKKTHEIKMC
jgi:hypothetical protein